MERDVLAELAAVLTARGQRHGTLVLAPPPVRHARSTIYFVTDSAQRSGGPLWVVKRPDHRATQEDLASPLGATHQFAALEAVARHFEAAPPGLRAVQPVGFLAGVEALAMEYVRGTPLDRLARPRALADPSALLGGVVLSGAFLRHLHAIRPPQHGRLDVAAEAAGLLALADERLRPAGLEIPSELRDALRAVPAGSVDVPIVQLHGDFAAVNMIMADGPSVTGIDVSLDELGPAETDLARFAMMLTTQRLFLAGGELERVRRLRRRIALSLLEGYAGEPATTALFELELVRQLCLRWLQRHTARLENHPRLGGLRRAPVDRYFRALLRERAHELGRDGDGQPPRLVLGGVGLPATG